MIQTRFLQTIELTHEKDIDLGNKARIDINLLGIDRSLATSISTAIEVLIKEMLRDGH